MRLSGKELIKLSTPRLSAGVDGVNHTVRPLYPVAAASSSSSTAAALPPQAAQSSSTAEQDLQALQGNQLTITLAEQAICNFAKIFTIRNPDSTDLNTKQFLQNCTPLLTNTLRNELGLNQAVKFQIFLNVLYAHPTGEIKIEPFNFKSNSKTVYPTSEANTLTDMLNEDYESILGEMDDFEARGSGWSLQGGAELQLRISKCLLYNNNGAKYVALPRKISRRKAVLNTRNTDAFCFKWAIISKLYTGKSNVPKVKELMKLEHPYDFDNLEFPLSINQIDKFERRNANTSVNVFVLDHGENIYPSRIVDVELEDHFDLLYIPTGVVDGHYALIRNFNRLIRPQIIGEDRNHSRHKLVICKRCFHHKRLVKNENAKTWLEDHNRFCKTYKPATIALPNKGERMRFRSAQSHVFIPIVIYLDLESSLLPVSTAMPDPENTTSYHHVTHIHENNSACLFVKSTLSHVLTDQFKIPRVPVLYRGDEALKHTLEDIVKIARNTLKLYKRFVPMKPLTPAEQKHHDEGTHCTLCRQLYNSTDRVKVKDHDHVTGFYRDHYCTPCNTHMKVPNILPICAHNLGRYDGHFIVKTLSKLGYNASIIPSTKETYISFSIKVGTEKERIEVRFVDTFRFLSTSLDKLVQGLPQDRFVETLRHNPPHSAHLLFKKGVYPYAFVKGLEAFEETSLPPRECFYNDLKEEEVSEEDYKFAEKLWHEMKFTNLGHFHDFYLRNDVLQLTDTFEEFRLTLYKQYKLDPLYSFTSSGYSWMAMLLTTQVELELISDYNQYLFVESAIRGGLVQSNTKFSQANNAQLENPNDYDPNKPSNNIVYYDCNALYSTAMAHYLPLGDFEWVENPDEIDWKNTLPTADIGYLLEVDIHIPEKVHDKLNDYPPLPLKQKAPGGKHELLLATLYDKSKYVLHYTILQQAVALGVEVRKIHKALKFRQSPWLKPFIELNIRLRQNAETKFHQEFFKLMNNSIFGKSIQNDKSKVIVKLISNPVQFLKETCKLNYTGFDIVDSDLAIVTLARRKVKLVRPIYTGQAILDISKGIMYNLFYNVLKDTFSNPSLIYTDTDSFVLHVWEDDILAKLQKQKDHFDFSTITPNHPLHSQDNHKVMGKLKDETGFRAIYQFIALRPKMYAFRYSSQSTYTHKDMTTRDLRDSIVKRAKGVQSSALTTQVMFANYKEALDNSDVTIRTTTKKISSKKHQVYTESIKKVALRNHDEKRYLQADHNTTLAYGHYRIRGEEDNKKTDSAD